MYGTTGSIVAISVGALLLAAGIYGFAEHSASQVSRTIAWPDWLCTGSIGLGLLVIAVTPAKRTRGRHAGR